MSDQNAAKIKPNTTKIWQTNTQIRKANLALKDIKEIKQAEEGRRRRKQNKGIN